MHNVGLVGIFQPPAMEPSLPLKDSYTVGWIAALSIELTAAIRMLDARYSYPIDFVKNPNDTNVYVWGKIGDHNVVIAFLEEGAYGTTPAAITATYLLSALPNIKIGLLVGIGAGIRRKDLGIDVRLGDVVISEPDGKSGGVYQYDLLKARAGNHVETTGVLNRPSTFLLKVLKLVKAQHLAGQSKVPEYLRLINPEMANPPNGTPGFVHQGLQNDRLFKSTFLHVSAPTGAEHSRFSTRVDLDADDSQRSLIGSLVMQLCQQDERAMQDLFGLLSEERAKHLSDRRLLEVFNLLAAYFGCTMIVIDGLDEVEKKQRSEILHWIRGIMASRASSDIRILASSRSMHDIETKLGCLDQTLLLHPEFVQKDIDEYVHKQVYDMESGFWRWRQKPHVRKEIEAVLKAKARGM